MPAKMEDLNRSYLAIFLDGMSPSAYSLRVQGTFIYHDQRTEPAYLSPARRHGHQRRVDLGKLACASFCLKTRA
jgi:hypothetical protein